MKYDIIGDVHGCYDELVELLTKLGYKGDKTPKKRRLIFAGDLVFRGPDSSAVLQLVMDLVDKNMAEVVLGNVDHKFMQALSAKKGNLHAETEAIRAELTKVSADLPDKVLDFLKSCPHKVAHGKLLVVHGAHRDGLNRKQEKRLAVFGEAPVVGKGGCVKESWAKEYAGRYRTIVRGHRPVHDVTVMRSACGARIINLDTGCASGGMLSALRYPEMEVVQVSANRAYIRRNWKALKRRWRDYNTVSMGKIA